MPAKSRQWLADAIRKHLIPEFEQRGFRVIPIPWSEPCDRDLVASLPFGQLRRHTPTGIEAIEIQLAQGRNAFSLNIGVIPPNGIPSLRGHLSADEVLVTWLDEFFELYSSPFFRSLFAVRRWPTRDIAEKDYEALVKQVAGLVNEVESVLRGGTHAPHIRRVKIRRAAPAA